MKNLKLSTFTWLTSFVFSKFWFICVYLGVLKVIKIGMNPYEILEVESRTYFSERLHLFHTNLLHILSSSIDLYATHGSSYESRNVYQRVN